MRKPLLVLVATLAIAACSDESAASPAALALCQVQKIGAPLSSLDSLPTGVELWKPTGDQISIGFRLDGRRQTVCTVTVGINQHVARVDMQAGA